MAKVERFEELNVWQEARSLARKIFDLTHSEDFAMDFGFINQVNKAAGSIMDNIAEGFERGGRKEFIQFLCIAKGSAGEVRSQLYRGQDRKYFSTTTFDELYNEVTLISRRLSSLINSLKASPYTGTKFKNRQ